jgi:hypothetical protein
MNEIINFLRSPSASIKVKFGATYLTLLWNSRKATKKMNTYIYHTELLVKPELPRLFILYIIYEDITEPLV